MNILKGLTELDKFKLLCLGSLVVANVVLVFSISLSRSYVNTVEVSENKEEELIVAIETFDSDLPSTHHRGTLYLTSTAVFCAEIIKLIASLYFEYTTSNTKQFRAFIKRTQNQVLDIDTIRIGLPGVLYVVENNLLFIALSNLSVTVFEVTDQLKIITTAYFSTVLLNLKLKPIQKVSLVLLAIGVATVEISSNEEEVNTNIEINSQTQLIGLIALILSCIISGFAGVYFEKLIKQNESISIYIRNVQLAIWGATFGLFTVFLSSESLVEEYGFFQNYNFLTFGVIVTLAITGILNAFVIKYADNVLKGFAASISTVVASLVSSFAFNNELNKLFVIGSGTVVMSIFLYGIASKQGSKSYSPSFVI